MDVKEKKAYKAWDEYYRQRERTHNGHGRNNFFTHRSYKAFIHIAEICIQYKFNVTDYISTSLNLVQRSSDYLTPRDLCSNRVVEAYIRYVEDFKSAVDNDWRTQIMRLSEFEVRMIPDKYPHTEALLMDPALQFSACFRVLFPEKFSEWLFKVYGNQAHDDLDNDKRLHEFVKNNVSLNLQLLVDKLGPINIV